MLLPALTVPAAAGAQSIIDQITGASRPAYASLRPYSYALRPLPPASRYSLPSRPIQLPITFTPFRRYWIPYRDQAANPMIDDGQRFRTVCVRICDGYYWPISFSTTRGQFYRDEAQCQSSCGGEARLFYHPNPGGGMADAVDQTGRAYTQLATAFLYRRKRIDGCACRPAPWSEAELARHRQYAREAPEVVTLDPVGPDPAADIDPAPPSVSAADLVPVAPVRIYGPTGRSTPGSYLAPFALSEPRRFYGRVARTSSSTGPRYKYVSPGIVLRDR